MKKLYFALLLFIFLLSSTTSSFAARIKYFKNYRINLLNFSFIGVDSLSEKEAEKAICNKFVYNESGRITRIEGMAYGLIFSDTKEKVAKIIFSYSDSLVTRKFYDKNDQPMRNKDDGVFGEEIHFTKNGYYRHFLDSTGQRTTNSLNIFLIISTLDTSKNIIIQQYFDKNNQPIRNEKGVYQTWVKYNEKNQPVEIRFLNSDGKLMLNYQNYAVIALKYGQTDIPIEERYFDTNGKPAASFPAGVAFLKRVGRKEKYFDVRGEPIELIRGSHFKPRSRGEINYDLIIKLDTRDLLLNILSETARMLNFLSKDVVIDKTTLAEKVREYNRRWHTKLDSLKKAGKIFRQGRKFYLFTSYGKEIDLANEIALLSEKEVRQKLRNFFLVSDKKGYEHLNEYADAAARACYGALKVDEIIFFQWEDVLFCVNPYYERQSGRSRSLIENFVVDFEKIPIDEKINHIFFENVNVKNYNPRTYFSNTKYYFSHCIVQTDHQRRTLKLLLKPEQTMADQVLFYKYLKTTFLGCEIDSLTMNMWSGDSSWPLRGYPSFIHLFHKCNIKSAKIFAGSYKLPGIKPIENTLKFIDSEFEDLQIIGDFTSLMFDNTKVINFYSSNVKSIEKKLEFINSSFESPLNFPHIKLSPSATFQMINTSYQGYMKFPWRQLKDKIVIEVEKDRLKTYGNLYNLLKSNYNAFSLIKDADDCYFYWKQFERRNFWNFYWREPDTHWYDPFDVGKAIGLMIFNHVNYFSCGYGVKPLWIFPFTLFIVGLFALIYFFMPTRISNLEEHLIARDKVASKLRKLELKQIKEIFKDDEFNFKKKKQDLIEDIISSIGTDELMQRLDLMPKSRYNLDFFWYCFYFSFSTFTTIGIGDWYPSGKLNKALVMIEGALGWLCLGLFITTYANILLR